MSNAIDLRRIGMAATITNTSLSHAQRNWMPAFAIPVQAVTTVLLFIRLLSRFHRNGGQIGLDDLFIFLAWVLGNPP
jgi:hypothetical protein